MIASRPSQAVAAFGLLEVLDASSASTQAARVTNLGGGRIGAYALVTSNANGDAYLVTDPSVDSPSDGALIVPLISAGAGAETYLYFTNRTATPISISVDIRGGGRRREWRMMEFDDIERILELVRQHDLAEFELEREGLKLRVRKASGGYPLPAAAASLPPVVPPAPETYRETKATTLKANAMVQVDFWVP